MSRSIVTKVLALLLALPLCAQVLQQPNGGTGNTYGNAQSAQSFTVSGLGSATHSGRVRIVTDGASSTDCSTGSGSTVVFCKDTGAAWTALPLSGMVYPGAGIPISTGTAWGTSISETDGYVIYGAAGVWSKGTALPNGITATTQALNDNSTKVATTAYADRSLFGKQYNGTPGTVSDGVIPQYNPSGSGKWDAVWINHQFGGGVPGQPSAGQETGLFTITNPVTFDADFTGSYCNIGPNGALPTSSQTFTIKKTVGWFGTVSTIGTVVVTSSGFTLATTSHAAQSLGSGDMLSFIAPNPADATLASFSCTLKAYLGATSPTFPALGSGAVEWPGAFTGNDIMLGDPDGVHAKDSGVQISTSSTSNSNSEVMTSAAVQIAAAAKAGGHTTIMPPSYNSVGQGTWAIQTTANAVNNYYLFNSTHATGDNLTYKILVAPGTYTLAVAYNTSSDRGKMDISIDGTVVRTLDQYSAGTVWNLIDKTTGITVTSTGIVDLKVSVNGKNASSSDFYLTYMYIELWRTA